MHIHIHIQHRHTHVGREGITAVVYMTTKERASRREGGIEKEKQREERKRRVLQASPERHGCTHTHLPPACTGTTGS